MKKKTFCRRLLAAILTLAMTTTMLPMALADECPKGDKHEVREWEILKEANCHEVGARRGECTKCGQTIYEDIPVDMFNHDTAYLDNGDGKTHTAMPCPYHPTYAGETKQPHVFDSTGRCSRCGALNYDAVTIELPREKEIYAPLGGGDMALSLGKIRMVIGNTDVTSEYELKYNWYFNAATVGTDETYLLPASQLQQQADFEYVCFIMARPKQSQAAKSINASCTVSVHVRDLIQAQATLSNKDMRIGMADRNNRTPQSVWEQIYDGVYARSGFAPQYLTFGEKPISKVGDLRVSPGVRYTFDALGQALDKVAFEPALDANGDYIINFNVMDVRGNQYPGVLTIHVTQFLGNIDVLATGTTGMPVNLDPRAFEDFWSRTFPSGQLTLVSFSQQPGPGEGYLTYGYQSASRPGSILRPGEKLYCRPDTNNQLALSNVTLTPTNRFQGCVILPFEAFGKNDRGTPAYLNGSLYVVFTNGQVQDVNMTASGPAKLDPFGFLTVYQSASASRGTNFYIQLLEVPASGAFYLNYTGGVTDRKLTQSEISATPLYYEKGRGSRIEDVTYVPGIAPMETVSYAAYDASGRIAYVGKLNLSSREIVVNMTVEAKGKNLSAMDFERVLSLSAAQANQTYVTFGRPSSGTLTYSKSGAAGTAIGSSDKFYLGTNVFSSVNNLFYAPAGQSAAVIPFTAATPVGPISGQVKITVQAAPVIPDKPIVYTKSFTDVKKSDWFYKEVMDLAEVGIINGMTDTTYAPNNNVTCGQALKLIMLATGYAEQAPTGKHWASGYMDRALKDGLITQKMNLDNVISRYYIATIATKAMKLKLSTEKWIYTDKETNPAYTPYVMALYEAGIMQGNNNKEFLGKDGVRRSEMAVVIWRINNYKK